MPEEMKSLHCVGKDGRERLLYYTAELSSYDGRRCLDFMVWRDDRPLAHQRDYVFFARFVEVGTELQLTEIFGDDLACRGVGIPDALINLVGKMDSPPPGDPPGPRTVVSSSKGNIAPRFRNEEHSPYATKMWERFVGRKEAKFRDEDGRDVLTPR